MARTVALIAALAATASAFVAPGAAAPRLSPRRAGDDVEPPPDATTKRIQSMVDDNTVMLFMKGTKIFPSAASATWRSRSSTPSARTSRPTTASRTSDAVGDQEFGLADDPQLVDGEFVGGSDIMLEMYEAGELQEMIEVAARVLGQGLKWRM
ncbi:protein disulfide oxidoreductase [Aureococcus anophagefferens]|nr:protein disulfide oxidoreductase [Aureococcus anophagefferens]